VALPNADHFNGLRRSSQYRRRISEFFETRELSIGDSRNMGELACKWLTRAFVFTGIISENNYWVFRGSSG
jgi:hypothetical protein